MNNPWIIVWLIGLALSLTTLPFILLSDKRPAGMLAWMWAVLLFPYLGALAFLLFGSERIYRRHLRRRRVWSKRRNKGEVSPYEGLNAHDNELAHLLSELNIYPSSSYAEAKVLLEAKNFYPALEKAISEAQSSILIEFYIWKDDAYGKRILALLTAAAQRGVMVKLILDEMGSLSLPKTHFQSLVDAGGNFSWFNALHLVRNRWNFSLRNHRKLQIIDGEVAFVGGMNIGREYMSEDPKFGQWKDVQIQITGPVIKNLCQTFWEDWHFATGEDLGSEMVFPTPSPAGKSLAQVIEDGPDSKNYPLVLSLVALLNAAKERAWFSAGYFFPIEPFLSALKLTAARGVDVRILIPTKSDHSCLVKGAGAFYEELLSYGVKLYEYEVGTHHAKLALIDTAWASVGSANLDVRSLRLNFELNVVVHSESVVTELEKTLLEDFALSKAVNIESVQARSTKTRLIENICRLMGPVL